MENTPRQAVSKDDIKMLLDNSIIEINPDNNMVIWRGGEYGENCKFSEVQKYANLKRLYCISNQLLLAVFPPEMFTCFKEIYILTYIAKSSILKYYLDMFKIEYEYKSISADDDGYSLIEYTHDFDFAFRKNCKKLIHICDNKKMNNYKSNALSKTWYERSKNDDRLKVLKCNLYNYYNRCLKTAKASHNDIMWTCFGDYIAQLKGSGYTVVRKLTAEERRLPKDKREKAEKKLQCFVPCNAKATNDFGERWALAYCVNMYINPMIRRFFTDADISINEDLYALSCLIQWIFRSRIRNGEPIELYIPNKRMRDLLVRWLNNEI